MLAGWSPLWTQVLHLQNRPPVSPCPTPPTSRETSWPRQSTRQRVEGEGQEDALEPAPGQHCARLCLLPPNSCSQVALKLASPFYK